MIAAKEPHKDVDDDGGPLKETHEEETQGEGRLRTQKEKKEVLKVVPFPSHLLRMLRKTGPSAHVFFLDISSLDLALASTRKPLLKNHPAFLFIYL